MKSSSTPAQLLTRAALGVGFLLPVMDRLGYMGAPGSPAVAWGDWKHFVLYTNSLMPFVSSDTANIAGLVTTIAEFVLGLCLIIGFKVKWMALGAALITLIFAAFMILSSGIAAPFKYPVFVFTGAALLLNSYDIFPWSIDNLSKKRSILK